MYRTGKLFHGCATVFVLYPLIIYVASTSLILVVEGSQVPLSQSDIKEAEKIVGDFLRNEAGTSWLSGLSKTRSAPLTTEDLMIEILRATQPGEKVWEAATILSETLKEQALKGIKTESVLGQAENWKTLIEHIENEDDIICLYRKNTGETAKKADDWKKFLKTVTPGYTVHLAIDTGRKYVICLKKIDIQITTTPEQISTAEAAPSTVVTSVEPPVIVEMTPPVTTEKLDVAIVSKILKSQNKFDDKHNHSEKKCTCKNQEGTENSEDDESGNDKNLDGSKYDAREGRGLYDEEYSARRVQEETKSDLRNKNPECNRPIIMVVQNGNNPIGYRPGTLEVLTQRNQGTARLLWSLPSSYPTSIPKISRSLKLPSPGSPFDLITPISNSQQFMRANKYTRSDYNLPCLTTQKPVAKSTPNLSVKPTQQPVATTVDKLILQNTRNAFVPQPLNVKTQRSQFVNQNSNFVKNMRYPIGDYISRSLEGQSGPSLSNSLIRRPSENSQLNVLTRNNVILPLRNIRNEANPVNENVKSLLARDRNAYLSRQVLQKSKISQLPSSNFIYGARQQQTIAQKPALQASLSFAPLTNIENPAQSSLIDREFLGRRSPPRIQSINQKSLQIVNPLGRQPPLQNQIQNSYSNNPVTNNLVRPNVLLPARMKSQFPVGPIPCNSVYNKGTNNPRDRCSLVDQLSRRRNPSPCPLDGYHLLRNSAPCPCNRPVKLQIMINGKLQEPLKISVIREPGQRVEIVGSGNPVMSYGSRSLSEEAPSMRRFEDKGEDIQIEDLKINKRRNESEEDTQEDVNKKVKGKKVHPESETEEEEKEDGMNKTVSSVVTVSDRDENLNNTRNSSTELNEQTTITDGPETETTEEQKSQKGFLDEVTKETGSTVPTTEVGTTMFEITNSTVDE